MPLLTIGHQIHYLRTFSRSKILNILQIGNIWFKNAHDAAAIKRRAMTWTQLSFLCQGDPIKFSLRCGDARRCEILSRPGECMNCSLNGETLVCLMALVTVTKGVWQPARTHKQKQHNLGQDGASSGRYATPSMIEERYAFCKAYVNCV